MLISVWWAVVAFILGGSAGVLALALFSGARELEEAAEREGVHGRDPSRRPHFLHMMPTA